MVVTQVDDVTACATGFFVMGSDDDDPALVCELCDGVVDVMACLNVELGGGFVDEEEIGGGCHSPCQHKALGFTT